MSFFSKSSILKPTNANTLGIFRFFFGLFMIIETYYYHTSGLIKKGFIAPKVLFPYDYLEFIKPLPEPIMHLILGLMALGAIMITIGWRHKIGSLIFFLGNTYFLLLDKGIYNNHIYLFSLIALLLIFTNASNSFSLKNKFSLNSQSNIRNWELWIFRFQIIIVYFYGGIAKINYDWLFRFEPMKTALKAISSSPIPDWIAGFMAYGSLMIDLSLGFLLLFKKTRLFAIIFLLIFHLSNGVIFNDIGIFPYLMIASCILFFDGHEIYQFIRTKFGANSKDAKKEPSNTVSDNLEVALSNHSVSTIFFPLLILYIAFQILFPLRHLTLPNQVDWTNIAQQFSWRMKIQSRDVIKSDFFIVDWDNNRKIPFKHNKYINTMQIKKMAEDPRMHLRFAHFIVSKAAEFDVNNPEIRGDLILNCNGQGPYTVINNETDLLKVDYSPFKVADWILPRE